MKERAGDLKPNRPLIARQAWIIDPDNQRVEVCRPPTERALIGSGGLLDGEDLLPGFQFPITDLFKEWDWQ